MITTSSVSIHRHYGKPDQKLEEYNELHLLPSFIAIKKLKRMTTSNVVTCRRSFALGKELER
jgi:hypothetical protein